MKSLLTAAVLAALPMTASAAVVSIDVAENIDADETYSYSYTLAPGDQTSFNFEFTALNDLEIATFSVSSTGTLLADIQSLRYGTVTPPATPLTTFGGDGGAGSLDFFAGTTMDMNDVFQLYISGDVTNATSITLSFGTATSSTPLPTPLPAAGLLLGTALVGGGLMSRKKKA